jgi:ribonuclease-3
MHPRGLRSKQHQSPNILEDVFEALCGAIYLSEGIRVLKPFVIHLIEKLVSSSYLMVEDNYKDAVMRYTHANHLPLPTYQVLNDPQATKRGQFDVYVAINGAWGRGQAATRKNAEQMAAMNLLRSLGLIGPNGHALVINKNQQNGCSLRSLQCHGY